MDEATRLVLDLQARLKDLDRKVWLYRRDMASEFTKYAEDLLRDVPHHISDAVSKAIAESMKECKSLYPAIPGDEPLVESCPESNDANGTTQISSPLASLDSAILPPAPLAVATLEAQDAEVPRSPHEREKEFRGLFTPSYLPLLDSTSHNEHKWSADAQPTSPPDKGKGTPLENMGLDASTSTSRLAATSESGKPPTPKRRNTDEVSIKSNCSDGPIRRSALRRSSSFSKVHSPRRVRFEVAGEEVLPTASPVPDPVFVPETGSSFTSFDDEEDGVSEQVEDIAIPAPPKRISSSQMLRNLSREPLADDGTQWTVVSSSPSRPTSNQESSDSPTSDPSKTNGDSQDASPPKTNARPPSEPVAAASIVDTSNGAKAEDQDSSEDEVLDMKPRRSKSQQPVDVRTGGVKLDEEVEPITPAPIAKKASPEVQPSDKQILNGNDNLKLHDDDDALFQFDEHADEEIPAPEPFHDDDDGSDSEGTIGEERGVNLSEFSRSPARSIPWPGSSSTIKSPSQSYRGHPFSEPVVNEQLHASLASLGAVHSFVGSLNGRSGMDESNMQSFRESLKYGSTSSFSGTPKSMTERMLMEDLLEAEEGRGD